MEVGSSSSTVSLHQLATVGFHGVHSRDRRIQSLFNNKVFRGKALFTCPKAVLLHLDCTLGSPGEVLKHHTPKPHPKAIKAVSQGLEFRHHYNFRLPRGELYSKAENGWFGARCLPKYFGLILGT